MSEKITSLSAGEVVLDEIILIANTQNKTREIDLAHVFAEFNLFEDIFSTSLYGNILISDSNNLLDKYAIQGLEGLRLKFHTPGLSEKQTIYKTFGIYSVNDQQVIMNDRLQTYRLHFASLELLNDALTRPLNRAMPSKDDGIEERSHDIVPFVFAKYLTKSSSNHIPKNLGVDKNASMVKSPPSDLVLGFAPYDYTVYEKHDKYSNVYVDPNGSYKGASKLKFIVPNWSPLKTISHASNKAIPENNKHAGTFMFYESNKAFHYCSIETLIKEGKKEGGQTFAYYYDPANINSSPTAEGYSRDILQEYQRVIQFAVNKNFNILDNQSMGLFGSQIRTTDFLLKRYREHNYSAEKDYENHNHTSNKKNGKDIGMFPHAPGGMFGEEETQIDPRANVLYRYREPFFLFDKDTENPLTTQPLWLSQRMARLSSLSNYSLQVLVHGRTDIKVGDVIDFQAPGLNTKDTEDRFLNGFFLITAIRHIVTPIKHMMTFEIIKEGLEDFPDKEYDTSPYIPYGGGV